MPEPSSQSLGLLNVLGMAIVGCLAFAVFIDEWLWTGLSLAAAGGLAVWAWREAKRLFPDDSGT